MLLLLNNLAFRYLLSKLPLLSDESCGEFGLIGDEVEHRWCVIQLHVLLLGYYY